ncbi:MAG: hypothetical protein JW888_18240 [Pirellulales bacterium]|nr:hypothetical protein [Pirellulales bacterium]
MDYGQEDLKRRFQLIQRDRDKSGFVVSIKLRVPHCFCREHHAPAANRLIDDYRARHPLDTRDCIYVEHESGPELILYLGLGVAGLGLARESLSLLKSAIELVTAILKARCEGRKQGDSQHGPLVVVVQGFGPDDTFYEKQAIHADPEDPPTEKDVEESLNDVIQLIAEERARSGGTP